MSELVHCSLCNKERAAPLWPVTDLSKENRVALKLMEVDGVCYACWEGHIAELSQSALVELSVGLMDDLMSLKGSYEELEKERDEQVEALEGEAKELRTTLEELQDRIKGVL